MKLPVVESQIQIRFADIDMLGHVSNSVYPQYMDLGRVDFFVELGKTEQAPISVVRSVSYDMLREITLMDKAKMITWCSSVDGKRMTVNANIFVANSCVAKGTTVLVGFDEKTRRACALPSHWEASNTPENAVI
jgi:acyl-CoA thioester hydrolase